MNITIIISNEDYKALEWQLVNPKEWIDDMVLNKINKCKKRMLLELSDKRLDKITKTEATSLIVNSRLKTRKQRDETTRTIT